MTMLICERRSPSCGLLGLVRAYFAADGMGNGIKGEVRSGNSRIS